MRRIRNETLVGYRGGNHRRRCRALPRRSKTTAEITCGRYTESPWPPRVLDGKMTPKQRRISALPAHKSAFQIERERAEKIAWLREQWAKESQ